jgi:hypothetical protein
MSHRKLGYDASGFTIVELTVTMLMLALLSTMFYTFFHSNLVNYVKVQQDGTSATTLATQASRISNVVRGLTDMVSASDNDMVMYSYFYPSDTYVSQLHYYLSGGQLLADVTRMSSNPPIGTPIAGSTKTFTIISNFYQATGVKLFTYYDASGAILATPLTNTTPVKSIRVNLAIPLSSGGSQSLSVQVALRNRKTNL